MKCNECVHSNYEANYLCSVCHDGNMFRARQKISYGSDLADSTRALKIAINSVYGFRDICNKGNIDAKTLPEIKNVIFNDSATIVFWDDGTKTVVKVVNEKFDPEKGLAMAIAKKALGNKGNYFNKIKKWTTKKP